MRHRFRDLVNLVLIARQAELDADAMAVALASQMAAEGLEQPERLRLARSPRWREGYATMAKAVAGVPPSLQEAERVAAALLDPVFEGHGDGQVGSSRGGLVGQAGRARLAVVSTRVMSTKARPRPGQHRATVGVAVWCAPRADVR